MASVAAQDIIQPCPKGTCELSDFYALLGRIFNFIVKLAIPLAVLGIGVGGFRIMMGSASEGEHKKGIEILQASVKGLIIVLAAWVIVNAILVALGVTGFTNPLK